VASLVLEVARPLRVRRITAASRWRRSEVFWRMTGVKVREKALVTGFW